MEEIGKTAQAELVLQNRGEGQNKRAQHKQTRKAEGQQTVILQSVFPNNQDRDDWQGSNTTIFRNP